MVSKVEEARIRREEKEMRDDHHPPQSASNKIKDSLAEDNIEKVPPLTRKSDISRYEESEEEAEKEDQYFNDSSDVFPPINPSPPKPTPSPQSIQELQHQPRILLSQFMIRI